MVYTRPKISCDFCSDGTVAMQQQVVHTSIETERCQGLAGQTSGGVCTFFQAQLSEGFCINPQGPALCLAALQSLQQLPTSTGNTEPVQLEHGPLLEVKAM